MCAVCSLNVHGNSTGIHGICHYICNSIVLLFSLQVDARVMVYIVEFLNLIFMNLFAHRNMCALDYYYYNFCN